MRQKLRPRIEDDDDLKIRFTDSYRKEIAKIYNGLWSDDDARDLAADLNETNKKRARAIALTRLRLRWLTFLERMASLSFRQTRISRPPGSNLKWIADFFCSKKTQRQITNEVISTMQYEYKEALDIEKRPFKAACIHVRGCYDFFKALGLNRLLKTLVDILLHAWLRR